MKQTLPQEIELWYLIPALRRELAKIFVSDYGLKQKEVSKILGITEASVSNYVKDKRGGRIEFGVSEIKKLRVSAKKIVEGKSSVVREIYNLCKYFKDSKGICKIHMSVDDSVEKGCDVCY